MANQMSTNQELPDMLRGMMKQLRGELRDELHQAGVLGFPSLLGPLGPQGPAGMVVDGNQTLDNRWKIEEFGLFQPDFKPVDEKNPIGDLISVGT